MNVNIICITNDIIIIIGITFFGGSAAHNSFTSAFKLDLRNNFFSPMIGVELSG